MSNSYNVLDHRLVRSLDAAGSGTLTNSAGDTAVFGSGASFTTQVPVGSIILAEGQRRKVVAVGGNASLTTDTPFSPALSGASFFLFRGTSTTVGFGTVTALTSQTVDGFGTSFTTQLAVGASILASNGDIRTITAINSDMQLTVDSVATWMGLSFTYFTDNNRAALNALIDIVDDAGGGTIFFPAGNYTFAADGANDTIMLIGRRNIRFLGEGPSSRLLWFGKLPGAGHMFHVRRGSQFITFEKLAILEGDGAKTDSAEQHHAIRLTPGASGTILTRNVENIVIRDCYFGEVPGDAINCLGTIAGSACFPAFPATTPQGAITGTFTSPIQPQRLAVMFEAFWDGGDITIQGATEPARGRADGSIVGNVVGFTRAGASSQFAAGMTVLATGGADGSSQRGTSTVATVVKANIKVNSVDTGTNNWLVLDGNHGLANNDIVRVMTTDTLPSPLMTQTNYYVINVGGEPGKLRLASGSGGAAIDLASAGSGTHTIAGTITLAGAIGGFISGDSLFEVVSETVPAQPGDTALTEQEFRVALTEQEFRVIRGATKSVTGQTASSASIGFAYLVRGVEISGNQFNGFDYSGRVNGNDQQDNGYRSAIGVQRLSADIRVLGNTMTGSGDQLIDFEPTGNGSIDHWVIEDNVIISGNPLGGAPDGAVTLFGLGQAMERNNRRSRFCRNRVFGRVFGGKMTGCDISDNVIVPVAGSATGSIVLTGRCQDIVIERNQLLQPPTTTGTPLSLSINSTITAKGVTLRDNVIEWYEGAGMRLDGVANALISGNRLAYKATTTNAHNGIVLEAKAGRPFGNVTIENNVIEGDAGGGTLQYGITVHPNGGAPAFMGTGLGVGGTGDIAPSWPNHQPGDIGLLFVQTDGQNVTTPSGWAAVKGSPQTTPAATAPTRDLDRLYVFWRRAVSSAELSPTIELSSTRVNPGDHAYAVIATVRGCAPSGNPWHRTAGDAQASSATMTIPGARTTVDDCRVVLAMAWGLDSANPMVVNPLSTGLTSVPEQHPHDAGTNLGAGGGLFVTTGLKATAGTYGATTSQLRAATTQARMSMAFAQTNLGITLRGNRGTGVQTRGIDFDSLGTYATRPIVIDNDFAGASTPIRLPNNEVIVIAGNIGDVQTLRSTKADPNRLPTLDVAPLSSMYSGGNGEIWQKRVAGANGWFLLGSRGRTLILQAVAGHNTGGGITFTNGSGGSPYALAAGSNDYFALPLPLKAGDRIESVSYHYQRTLPGASTFKLFRVDMSTGTSTQVGATINGTATGYATATDAGIDHTLVAGNAYFVEWFSGASSNRFYGVTVSYDGP